MAKFLSKEWVEVVQTALQSSDQVKQATQSAQATIQQQITGGPEGDVSYHIMVDKGTVEAALGEADSPTFVLATDYETAGKINRGETTGQAQMMTGKLKFQGDMMKVMTLQGAVQAIQGVLNTVPTEY
jgi:putative sterol carrier protein